MNWFLSLCSELAEVMAQSVPSIKNLLLPDLFRALLKHCLLNKDVQVNLNMNPLPRQRYPVPFPLVFFSNLFSRLIYIYLLPVS